MVRVISNETSDRGWVPSHYVAAAHKHGWTIGYRGRNAAQGVVYLFRTPAPVAAFATSANTDWDRPPAIQFANLEPTDCCNLSCRYCVRPERANGPIPLPLAQQALEQIASIGAKYVSLCFAGEPLLHSGLPAILAFARSSGLACSIDTNGLLLTPQRLTTLIEAGLGKLTVSMDGGDPASYEALRGRDGFREVCESVLHALDEVFIPPSFQVVISIMRLPTTELFVAMEQLNFWHRPPVAHVKMFYPHNWADPGLLPTRTVSGPCPQPWSNLTVTCDGQVLPCDIDLGKHLVMGSLCNSTLPEILAGRAYQSLLDAHRIGQLPSVCRSCLFRERAIAETEDSAHVKL